ncbi:MAG: phospholipid carrier-dependent glycosyltransferase [bacterium]
MKRAGAIFLVFFLVVYILPLGMRPIIIPDESRYSETPREMIASGDWISPKLMGIRYFEKPVFGYWLNAASMSLFGQNNFANRLPAAVAAGVSALLLMFLLASRAGTRTGLIAAGILLSSILVFVLGTFNVLDGPFSMCITGTMVFFFMAYSEGDKRRRIVMLCLCGVFCGLAFLTKGFLAFALPAIVVAPFLVWERRWKAFLTMPWIPALAALLIALPWCVMIAIREPDFWNYFFWVEHVGRFIKPGQPQHPEPFWYFVPLLTSSTSLL